METFKVTKLIKDGNIVIPIYMFKLYKKYKLNLDELVFLMYLCNKNFTTYDPVMISGELGMDINEVMGYISQLADKNLISLDIASENGIMEEKLNLDLFYDKVSLSLMEREEKKNNNDTIFSEIEKEFGRSLTPLEREVVIDWDNRGYSYELIHEALKIASLNGALNIRYIDKILDEWHKNGVTKKDEIKKENKTVEMEIYDCNWLDDDEI